MLCPPGKEGDNAQSKQCTSVHNQHVSHGLLTIVKFYGGPHVGLWGDGVYSYSEYLYALYFSLSQYINLQMWIGFTVYFVFIMKIRCDKNNIPNFY